MPGRSDADICNMALIRAGVNQKIGSLQERSAAAQACSTEYNEQRRQILNEFRWKFAVRREELSPLSGVAFDATVTYAEGDMTQFGVNVYRSLLDANLNNLPNLEASAAWWAQVTRDGYRYVCPLPDDTLNPIAIWPKVNTSATDVFWFPRAGDANLRNPRSYERIPYVLENSDDGTDLQILLTDVQFPILKYVADVTNSSAFPAQFVEVYAWKLAEPLAMALRGDEKKAAFCAGRYKTELASAFMSDTRDSQEDPEPTSEFEDARHGGSCW